MTNGDETLTAKMARLSDHSVEKLMFAVMEQLVVDAGTLPVADEEESRDLLAAAINSSLGEHVNADDLAPPAAKPVVLARSTLNLLAEDPATSDLVRDSLETLPDDTQMIVDPITTAVVVAALVAFLQTKLHLKVKRVGGKLDMEISASKEPTSPEMIGKVIDGVRRAAIP